MKPAYCLASSLILGFLFSSSMGFGQIPSSQARDPDLPASAIHDPIVKQIVETLAQKIAPLKGYTAEVEMQALDPNGGFDKFRDQQTVCLPDRMRVERKVLVAHNADAEGQDITIVVDGRWSFARIGREHAGFPEDPSYSKTDLKAVAQAGGPSIPEYLSMMGNIADPLRPYRLDTLALAEETRTAWVLVAEFKDANAPWSKNRLTIDKQTGFLRTLEAMIPELEDPSVLILKVIKVAPKDGFEESLFKIDMPAPDSDGSPFVLDDTDMWIDSLKAKSIPADE